MVFSGSSHAKNNERVTGVLCLASMSSSALPAFISLACFTRHSKLESYVGHPGQESRHMMMHASTAAPGFTDHLICTS